MVLVEDKLESVEAEDMVEAEEAVVATLRSIFISTWTA